MWIRVKLHIHELPNSGASYVIAASFFLWVQQGTFSLEPSVSFQLLYMPPCQ